MAEGRSNAAICRVLSLQPKALETHVSRVFTKLGLSEEADGHRRVPAVPAHLREPLSVLAAVTVPARRSADGRTQPGASGRPFQGRGFEQFTGLQRQHVPKVAVGRRGDLPDRPSPDVTSRKVPR